MKLQTQFTIPNKELKDLDYVKKVDFLEETLNKECMRFGICDYAPRDVEEVPFFILLCLYKY